MRGIASWFYCGLVLVTASCGVNEIRNRRATLEKLLATNAPLSAVESAIGQIPIYKPGSSEWSATRSNYARYSYPQHQRMLQRIDRAAAFGHTSTMSMQTWIFLDDRGRLVDFEVGAQ